MEEEKKQRETVGKIASDLMVKDGGLVSPIELEREAQKNYYDELLAAVARGKQIYEGDFYIHVATKMEHLMKNVTRNYFIVRSTCPTPFFDQSVFKYLHKEEQLLYIWTIPDRGVCHYLRDNAMEVAPEERQLLQFVLEFYDGTLLNVTRQLNGETNPLDIAIVKVEDPDTLIKT